MSSRVRAGRDEDHSVTQQGVEGVRMGRMGQFWREGNQRVFLMDEDVIGSIQFGVSRNKESV